MRVAERKSEKDEMSDDALLLQFSKGDMSAARLLTERLTPRILAYSTRLLGGDQAEAEDVTQDAMLRLWQFAPNWRQGEAQVSTWLYRVAGNLCIDRIRKPRPEQLEPDDVKGSDENGAELGIQTRARLSALYLALRELPDRQRQAVVLRHIEGLSNGEIAQVMGTGVEAVESLTARGKRTLTRLLLSKQEELGFRDD